MHINIQMNKAEISKNIEFIINCLHTNPSKCSYEEYYRIVYNTYNKNINKSDFIDITEEILNKYINDGLTIKSLLMLRDVYITPIKMDNKIAHLFDTLEDLLKNNYKKEKLNEITDPFESGIEI